MDLAGPLANSEILQDLLQPHVMPFLVAIVAIAGGITLAIVKLIIRHRERMAKIERGIDPDAQQTADRG